MVRVVQLVIGFVRLCFLLMVFLHQAVLNAKEVQLPESELQSEAVLPVFDFPEAVKERTVSVAKKYEIELMGGASLTEPFFGPFNFGGAVTYNFTEESGLYASLNYWMEGESVFKKQLEADGLLVLTGAPRLEYLALLNYQYAPYYGKMSLTKHRTSNFHLYVLGGGGIASIGGEMVPTLSAGIGQKFYWSPSFALRFDLLGLFYSGPDPLTATIDANNTPATSDYEKRLFINLLLTAGLVFVL